MDEINALIAKLTSGDPMLFYIVSGCALVVAIYFIRRVLQIIGILLMVVILFVAWNHFTGNPIPFEIPKDLTLDSVIDYAKKFMEYMIKLLPISGDDVAKTVGGATTTTPPPSAP